MHKYVAVPGQGLVADGVVKSFAGATVLLGASLDVAPGAVVALLGPSGCGKTTLLRVMAGLDVPDGGTVSLEGRVLVGPRCFVPPERRRIGMVFQDWALFPHMDVGANVGFGLPRRERRNGRVEGALAMVGLEGMARRLPGTLSGGQQQRVALARALAPEPQAILLDEPFSNLDTTLRLQVRSEVLQLLRDVGITTVFVTHDQEEAFVLGDEVAVMSDGRIVQQAPPAEIYAHPATPWVAGFVGDANLVPGQARAGRAETPLGWVALTRDQSGVVQVLMRPEDVRLEAGQAGSVEAVEFYGHDTVYRVALDNGLALRVRAMSAPTYSPGDRVAATFAGPATVAFPARAGVPS